MSSNTGAVRNNMRYEFFILEYISSNLNKLAMNETQGDIWQLKNEPYYRVIISPFMNEIVHHTNWDFWLLHDVLEYG